MGNLTLEDVNNMYLDVLKEIGNIGAGNATTAIANMLGMKIDIRRRCHCSYSPALYRFTDGSIKIGNCCRCRG